MQDAETVDESLMNRVARGDGDALRMLVERYATGLLTFITRMVGDRHQAEELFQEVFLAVWRERRRYDFPRPFRPWLFGIAANQCRADFRRAQRAAPAEPLVELAAAREPSPAQVAVDAETAAIVTAAVAELPPKQRTVVVLRVWNGFSYAEIARILELSEATVRSHMFHGLAALRRSLEFRLR